MFLDADQRQRDMNRFTRTQRQSFVLLNLSLYLIHFDDRALTVNSHVNAESFVETLFAEHR